MPATKRSLLCGLNPPGRYTDILRELKMLPTSCEITKSNSSTSPTGESSSNLDGSERILTLINDTNSTVPDDDDFFDELSLHFSGPVEYECDIRPSVTAQIEQSIANGSIDPANAFACWAYKLAAINPHRFIRDENGNLVSSNFRGLSVSRLRRIQADTLPQTQVLHGTPPTTFRRDLPRATRRTTSHKSSGNFPVTLPHSDDDSGYFTDEDDDDSPECPDTPVVPSQGFLDRTRLYTSDQASTSRIDVDRIDWDAPVFFMDEDDEEGWR